MPSLGHRGNLTVHQVVLGLEDIKLEESWETKRKSLVVAFFFFCEKERRKKAACVLEVKKYIYLSSASVPENFKIWDEVDEL